MASKRIRGITIDIDGNVTKLSDSLKSVDTILSKTESNLKDVNRLLKLDPTNTELLSQKQKLLNDAITSTKEKLEIEKDALERVKAANKTGEMTEEQMALEREIASTQIQLRRYGGTPGEIHFAAR
jgi:phage-related minor tail protein